MANRKIKPIRVEGNIAYVPLTKGYEAVIDAEDVHLVSGRSWQANVSLRADGTIGAVYAVHNSFRDGKCCTTRMHRVIAKTPDGMETDHADSDGLNNRKSNLRNATKAQNQQNQRVRVNNRSGAKGVTLHKKSGRWIARIGADRKMVHLGYFDTVDEAAAAYVNASARLHGAFGRS